MANNYNPNANVENNTCTYDDYGGGGGEPTECASVSFDGYTYETVLIGDQCWFAENLRTEHYADGSTIPANLSLYDWKTTTSGATAVYGDGTGGVYGGSDDEVTNLESYGRLYNWFAVDDSRGLCPSGWHVPTDGEWMTLEMELGMTSSEANSIGWRGTYQGAQMKSSSSDSPSWDGTNISGFSALPGGMRSGFSGHFDDEGSFGYWWSASPESSFGSWRRFLFSNVDQVFRGTNDFRFGFSARCVRDE